MRAAEMGQKSDTLGQQPLSAGQAALCKVLFYYKDFF